jgi:hypothetical protein
MRRVVEGYDGGRTMDDLDSNRVEDQVDRKSTFRV